MKIYVASSWRNKKHEKIVELLRDNNHEVYDFKNPSEEISGFSWDQVDDNWQNWTNAEYVQALYHPNAIAGFHRDLLAMRWADAFVLVNPCGRSAHLELGWAIGSRKPNAILLDENDQDKDLMYKLADYICLDTQSLVLWAKSVDSIITLNQ